MILLTLLCILLAGMLIWVLCRRRPPSHQPEQRLKQSPDEATTTGLNVSRALQEKLFPKIQALLREGAPREQIKEILDGLAEASDALDSQGAPLNITPISLPLLMEPLLLQRRGRGTRITILGANVIKHRILADVARLRPILRFLVDQACESAEDQRATLVFHTVGNNLGFDLYSLGPEGVIAAHHETSPSQPCPDGGLLSLRFSSAKAWIRRQGGSLSISVLPQGGRLIQLSLPCEPPSAEPQMATNGFAVSSH